MQRGRNLESTTGAELQPVGAALGVIMGVAWARWERDWRARPRSVRSPALGGPDMLDARNGAGSVELGAAVGYPCYETCVKICVGSVPFTDEFRVVRA